MNTSHDTAFKLIESLLWTPENGFFLLDGHMSRLEKSATHFNFPFHKNQILNSLKNATSPSGDNSLKIRLLLSENGHVEISSAPIGPPPESAPFIKVHSTTVDSSDVFLRHKTTRRQRCDDALKQCVTDGLYDFLFTNEKGELTEGAWNNLVVEHRGKLFTPPEECGLLPGVFRADLLEKRTLQCKILKPADLLSADKIFLCNSVRGMVEVAMANK